MSLTRFYNYRLYAVTYMHVLLADHCYCKKKQVLAMSEYEHGWHTIHDIKYHFVCLTKYRYNVLAETIREGLKVKRNH